MWDLSYLTRMEPVPPAVEAWNHNHWTSREDPILPGLFFKIILFILAVLGLCHHAGFSLVAVSVGHSLVAAQGLLIAAFSLAAESRV